MQDQGHQECPSWNQLIPLHPSNVGLQGAIWLRCIPEFNLQGAVGLR